MRTTSTALTSYDYERLRGERMRVGKESCSQARICGSDSAVAAGNAVRADVEAFVARLYEKVLGRTPDAKVVRPHGESS